MKSIPCRKSSVIIVTPITRSSITARNYDDGRTYPESQREATQGLSNLTQVVVKNAGHNLFMVSPEVTKVIQQFMNNETIKTTEIEFDLPPFVK